MSKQIKLKVPPTSDVRKGSKVVVKTKSARKSKSISSSSSSPLRQPVTKNLTLLSTPMFQNSDNDMAVSTSMHRRFEITGNLNRAVRCHLIEPLAALVRPKSSTLPNHSGTLSFPGFNLTTAHASNTIDTNGLAFVLGLNPYRHTFMKIKDPLAGSYDYGIAFSDSTILCNIASGFAAYRVSKFRLHYRPIASTSESTTCAIAWTVDAGHPRTGATFSGNALGVPTMNWLETSNNTVMFAPWVAWSADFPVSMYQNFTHFKPVYVNGLASGGMGVADIRESCFGALTCLVNQLNGTDTSGRLGEFYWELEIEMSDPTPISSFLSLTMQNEILKGQISSYRESRTTDDSKETKEEKKTERRDESPHSRRDSLVRIDASDISSSASPRRRPLSTPLPPSSDRVSSSSRRF